MGDSISIGAALFFLALNRREFENSISFYGQEIPSLYVSYVIALFHW